MPIPRRRSLYEWLALLLLLSPATVGIVLFGAVRNWSAGALMALVYIGVILYLLRPLLNKSLLELRIPMSGLLFGPFLLYTAIWIPFAPVPYEAMVELLRAGSFFGAYWAWTELATRYKRWRILLGVPLFLGTLIAWYALIQHAQGSSMVLNMMRPDQYEMRASGTFMAPTHFAAYLGTMICLALALVSMPSAGPMLRLLGGYGLLLFLPALFLSQSRSGWVGAVVGISVFTLLMMWRKSIRAALLTLIALPLLFGALLGALWWGSPMFKERASEAIAIQGTAAHRVVMWKDTIEMVKDRPVFGHGPGSYRWVYPPYKSWGAHRWLDYAHNEFLQLMADYGLVGFGLLCLALLALLIRLLVHFHRMERGRDACLTAGFLAAVSAGLTHAFFDFNLHVFSLVHTLVLFGGVTMANLYTSDRIKGTPMTRVRWFLIALPGLFLCIVGVFYSARISASGAATRLAEERLTNISLQDADLFKAPRAGYLRAVAIDPSYWIPYLQLGNLSRREAFWRRDPDDKRAKAEEALHYYTLAFERNPHDSDVLFGMGKSYYLMGDGETSVDYLRQAIALWPTHLYYARELGLQLRAMGRDEEALAAFQYAATLERDAVVQLNIKQLKRRLSAP